MAMATSGLAVIFSGLTVIVSLAGLFMVDNDGDPLDGARGDPRRGRIAARRGDAAAGADPAARPSRVRGLAAVRVHPPRSCASRTPRRAGSTRPGYVAARLLAALDRGGHAPAGRLGASRPRRSCSRSPSRRSALHTGDGRAAPAPRRPRGARRLRGRRQAHRPGGRRARPGARAPRAGSPPSARALQRDPRDRRRGADAALERRPLGRCSSPGRAPTASPRRPRRWSRGCARRCPAAPRSAASPPRRRT